jgi:hypothetical protein
MTVSSGNGKGGDAMSLLPAIASPTHATTRPNRSSSDRGVQRSLIRPKCQMTAQAMVGRTDDGATAGVFG